MKLYKDKGNNIFAYEEDGSQDYLIPKEYIRITQEEANILIDLSLKQMNEEYQNNLTYAQKRVNNYPLIGDQLDMLYHDIKNGNLESGVWIQTIEAVKQNYPKPE